LTNKWILSRAVLAGNPVSNEDEVPGSCGMGSYPIEVEADRTHREEIPSRTILIVRTLRFS
jgi:hypothetical protein